MTTPGIDVDRMDTRINRLGAGLYFDPVTVAHAAEHGLTDVFALYGAGRAGVMGDVSAEVVLATFGFFHPAMVQTVWDGLDRPASEVATIYAEGMAAAAREHWDPEAAAVVAAIGAEAVADVPALGLSLFAGSRSLPVPDDPCGAASRAVLTLRELRGDVNIQSVAGQGLTPLEAEMACRGEGYAELHGWPAPYPEVTDAQRKALARADEVTSRRMAAVYAPLGDRLAELDAAIDALAHPS